MIRSFGDIRKHAKRISKYDYHLKLLRDKFHRESTGPRDEVCGVLDLVDCWHSGKFAVDYNSSVSEVYSRAVNSTIEHWKRLDFLAEMDTTQPELRLPELPTWCPDWSICFRRVNDDEIAFNLNDCPGSGIDYSRSSICSAFILDDEPTLDCQGIILDELRDVVDGPYQSHVPAPYFENILNIIELTNARNDIQQKERLWRTLVSNRNWDSDMRTAPGSNLAPLEFEAEFEFWIKSSEGFDNSSLESCKDQFWSQSGSRNPFRPDLRGAGSMAGTHQSFAISCYMAAKNRRFFMTNNNHMGLAPLQSQPGDIVAVLYGCNLPVILRPVDIYYEFVGPADVLGFEKGEAIDLVKAGELKETWFEIE
ncbi:hypothetical protein IFR05_003747 [Cadophora sp. M221]|nr:hypothetical protein IFR05_003747 [Cadophora sp. M221]